MKFGKCVPLDVRFWANVVRGPSCWQWTAAVTGDGYGRIFANGKGLRAHRVSYELHCGPVPAGVAVLHRCDNPPCCNPEHLYLGTPADNARDRSVRGRGNTPSRSGDRHWMRRHPDRIPRGAVMGRSKLNDEMVAELRARHASGSTSQRALAKQFGIGYKNLNLILKRKTWRHVP